MKQSSSKGADMKVVFRTDASPRIGSGHLSRCLTLAMELRSRGAEVAFVAREHVSGRYQRVTDAGLPLHLLPGPPSRPTPVEDGDYAGWLGVSVERDADETAAALDVNGCDVLVVDHYALGAEWEGRFQRNGLFVAAIDDLAEREHDANLLLDQNLRTDGGARYQALVPRDAALLVGPHYALLRSTYREARAAPDASEEGRVLVMLGGAPDRTVLRTVLDSLCDTSGPIRSLDVLDPEESLQGPVDGCHRGDLPITIHREQPELTELMARAQVAVGAGGVTAWERMCLGLPTVSMSMAANQQAVLAELAGIDAVLHLGSAHAGAARRSGPAVAKLLGDSNRRANMARLGQLLVDGRGAERVANALLPHASRLRLRDVHTEDMGLLWLWANDTTVRGQAIETDPIPWRDHRAWFDRCLTSEHTLIFVLDADGVPIGQIRFDIQDRQATISYSLDAAVRGRGLAKELVRMGVAELSQRRSGDVDQLVAVVRDSNQASLRVFLGLGFEECARAQDAGELQRFLRPVGASVARSDALHGGDSDAR